MKQVFSAEAIGLTPEQEHRARRTGELRAANRAVRPRMDELTGLMLSGAFLRRRLKAKADYTHANSRGTRGVWLFWTLTCGPLYQARYRTDWADEWHERYLTVAADGRLLDVTEQEVRAWLANAPSASTS
ncbi:hypothetical protein ACWCV5_32725 [Streptomyces tubercidicus]